MSEPTADELRARAEALVPRLRERVPQTRALRRVPEESIAELMEAGFFRMLQPRRHGGYEMDPADFFDVQVEIARGCASTAWVLGVVAVHAWQLALFDERAQEEVWAEGPDALISSSYMPVGKVEPVEGGFRLSGRWSYSSGSDHCQWIFLGAFVPTTGRPEMRTFLLPRSDYEIVDNWHTSGLQGTGSKDIVVEQAFVPMHRTHALLDGFRCQSPGNALNTAPLFRVPFGQIFVRSVSSTAIGITRAALESYCEVAGSRVAQSDGAKVAEDTVAQVACARAAYIVRETSTLLRRDMELVMERARSEQPLTIEERARLRFDSAMVVERCVEAVDALFTASGGRAIFSDNPMQPFFQDIHAARAHFANNPEKPGRNLGRLLLGLSNTDFFI